MASIVRGEVPYRITPSEQLLTRKEVRWICQWSESTLRRRERQGLPILDGRISPSGLAWWMERRDAARKAGMPVREFLALPEERQRELMADSGGR